MSKKTIVKVAATAAAVWFLFLRKGAMFAVGPGSVAESAKNKNDTGVVRGAA